MAYFRQHKIQSITLQGDKVVIEYQSSKTETRSFNSSSELQKVKSYLGKIGKSKLTLSDLEQGSSDSGGNPGNPKKPNSLTWLWILLIVLILLLVIIVIGYLLKARKRKKVVN